MDTLLKPKPQLREPLVAANLNAEPALEGVPALPTGPAGAAILSAGIGCFALGLFALAGDGWPAIAKFFIWYHPTGPLSGVTTSAILVWLVAWYALARVWKGRSVAMAKVNIAAFLLLAVGVLLTFPPFGDLLLGK